MQGYWVFINFSGVLTFEVRELLLNFSGCMLSYIICEIPALMTGRFLSSSAAFPNLAGPTSCCVTLCLCLFLDQNVNETKNTSSVQYLALSNLHF